MRRRACDACHRRKIQCDGEPPDTQCNWCHHHKATCTWNRVPRRRGRARGERSRSSTRSQSVNHSASVDPAKTETASGSHHPEPPTHSESASEKVTTPTTGNEPYQPPLKSIEATTAAVPLETPPGQHQHALSQNESQSGVFFGKLHFAGHDLGDISSYNGIPIFSAHGKDFIRTRTGQDPVFPTLILDGPHGHNPRQLLFSALTPTQHPAVDLSLPDRKVVEDYLRFFRTSFFKLEFPVVDGLLFQETIEKAYKSYHGSPPPEAILAKACIFAFLSVVSLFEREFWPTTAPPLDGDVFATKAQYFLPLVLQEFNMTVLQTVLMLSVHQLFSGHVPSASLFHSLACRIIFTLGGHILTDPWSGDTLADNTTREKRHLRRLFWLCYIFDKEIALRTGQPTSINDEQCDLTLPEGYLDVQYLDRSFYSHANLFDDAAVPLHPGDLRLAIIKSKACKVLYSEEALRKSDAELLRDIRELDDELESWRQSVPIRHRPVLAMPKPGMERQLIECPENVRSIVIHFEYHHLVATIHRATGRCRAWAKMGSGELDGVSSSLAISVEASRSTLLYLRFAIDALVGEAFWLIVFYPMTAASSLFLSILLDPLNCRAQDDLELLSTVPGLIKNIRLRRLTKSEMLHFKMVDDFLAELIRLGRCAIEYAGRKAEHDHLPETPAFSPCQ